MFVVSALFISFFPLLTSQMFEEDVEGGGGGEEEQEEGGEEDGGRRWVGKEDIDEEEDETEKEVEGALASSGLGHFANEITGFVSLKRSPTDGVCFSSFVAEKVSFIIRREFTPTSKNFIKQQKWAFTVGQLSRSSLRRDVTNKLQCLCAWVVEKQQSEGSSPSQVIKFNRTTKFVTSIDA
ncbi:hypothetical protein M8J77_017189 [Diaphorina citri]|nr:hypothetical protein M8J77_017189 [Diaphorina citri]